jgi:hypothetical protein
MDKNLFDDEELKAILAQLEEIEFVEPEMNEEMIASQKRYEEYILKHVHEEE